MSRRRADSGTNSKVEFALLFSTTNKPEPSDIHDAGERSPLVESRFITTCGNPLPSAACT
jgi:hypothetical protein